jgi:transcriptional regulator with XRE-family HTH domain
MITSRQVRAARAFLGWTQEKLADKAVVALTALKRLESDPLKVREDTCHRVRRALQAAGIAFVDLDHGEGVMLIRNRPPPAGSPKESAAKSHSPKPPSKTGRAQ